jgi:hypothetical protein
MCFLWKLHFVRIHLKFCLHVSQCIYQEENTNTLPQTFNHSAFIKRKKKLKTTINLSHVTSMLSQKHNVCFSNELFVFSPSYSFIKRPVLIWECDSVIFHFTCESLSSIMCKYHKAIHWTLDILLCLLSVRMRFRYRKENCVLIARSP